MFIDSQSILKQVQHRARNDTPVCHSRMSLAGIQGDGQLHCTRLTYLSIRKVAEGLT